MAPIHVIIAKELRSYFVSPVVYVVGAVFLLSVGLLSYLLVYRAGIIALQQMQFSGTGATAQLNLNELVFRPVIYWTGFLILLILIPLLTMRLFAEERKLRTFELLMTSPIDINEIVAGKFLSVYLIFLVLLGLSGIIPLILSIFAEIDWNPVLVAYLGLALQGALFAAVGVFASSLTENQIISALLSFGLLFCLWLLGIAGANLGDTAFGNVTAYISFAEHFDHLVRGLIDTKDLVYYFSGSIFMLFLAHRVVESSRWK